MVRASAVVLAFSIFSAAAQQPWEAALEESVAAAADGHPDRAVALAEKAWHAVREAGLGNLAYPVGANAATSQFLALGRPLRAEAIYEYAISAAHKYPRVERDLRIGQAKFFERRGMQVKAESVWESILAAAELAPRRSGVYAIELIALASVKQELGKLAEAERLYRSAIAEPTPRPEEWPTDDRQFAELLDARIALADFYAPHGRMEEADELLRKERRRDYLERRIHWFEQQEKWDQAIALQRELIQMLHDGSASEGVDCQRLADLLEKSGSKDEALIIVRPFEDSEKVDDRLTIEQFLTGMEDTAMGAAFGALEKRDFDRALDKFLEAIDSACSTNLQGAGGIFRQIASRFATAGRQEAVRLILERYLLAMERLFGQGSPQVLLTLRVCAIEYASAGLTADARRLLERLEFAVVLHAGPESPEMEDVLKVRAEILRASGAGDESLRTLREWFELCVLLHGALSGEAADGHRELAKHYAQLGKHREAHAEWLAAIESSRSLRSGLGSDHAEVLSAASQYFASQKEFDLAQACNAEAAHAVQSRAR